jgi:hypothetical protein
MPNSHIVITVKCAGPNCERVCPIMGRDVQLGWWMVSEEKKNGRPLISITDFDYAELATNEKALPVCGQDCMSKLVSRFMSILPDAQKMEG